MGIRTCVRAVLPVLCACVPVRTNSMAQAPLSPPQLPASNPALQQRLADLESSLWQEQQQLRLEQMRLQHIASQFHARNNDLLGGGAGACTVVGTLLSAACLSFMGCTRGLRVQ